MAFFFLPWERPTDSLSLFFFFFLAALSLSCGTQNLHDVMQDLSKLCADSLAAACGFSCRAQA